MNKILKTSIILGLLIAGLVCLVVAYIVPNVANKDIVYKGQEVFLTEEEYADFKVDLKNKIFEDNLELVTFEALASEPPIIVSFEVKTPYNYELPFGSSSDRIGNIISTVAFSLVIGLLFIFIPATLLVTWE